MSIRLFLATVCAVFLGVTGGMSAAWAQNNQVLPPSGWLPPVAANPGTNSVECYNNATIYGLLSQQQAYTLCLGAQNSAPFDCFQQAIRTGIDDATALKLCRCTVSTGRVDCYNQAHRTTDLSDNEILNLCTHDINANPACSPTTG